MVRQTVRDFAEKYLDPIAVELDETGRFPKEVIEKMAEMDWMGVPFAAEYGGAGADYLTYTVMVEEISRSCAPPLSSCRCIPP